MIRVIYCNYIITVIVLHLFYNYLIAITVCQCCDQTSYSFETLFKNNTFLHLDQSLLAVRTFLEVNKHPSNAWFRPLSFRYSSGVLFWLLNKHVV